MDFVAKIKLWTFKYLYSLKIWVIVKIKQYETLIEKLKIIKYNSLRELL